MCLSVWSRVPLWTEKNPTMFVPVRTPRVRFPDQQHVQRFRQPWESGTKGSDVLRERDHVPPGFILPAFADPHKEARRGEAAKHFLHLRQPVQNGKKFVRYRTRVCIICDSVAMMTSLKKTLNEKKGRRSGSSPHGGTCRTLVRANAFHGSVLSRCDTLRHQRAQRQLGRKKRQSPRVDAEARRRKNESTPTHLWSGFVVAHDEDAAAL